MAEDARITNARGVAHTQGKGFLPMADEMSSRERMLAALELQPTDHVPLAFMIFGALNRRVNRQRRGGDQKAVIETQLDLGLDAVVDLMSFSPVAADVGHSDLPGMPVRLGEDVRVQTRLEAAGEGQYPVLHKEYATPSGTLSIAVDRTDDWPYGDDPEGQPHVPFMDDYLAPRCSRHLVSRRSDLAAFRHLLKPPTQADIAACRASWQAGRELADRHGLLLTGGWGVGADSLAWFCGLQQAVMMALDEPAFLEELLGIVAAWNRLRMEVFLDFGVDLFIRRAWYEGTDFWSPKLWRQLFYPILRDEVALAHEAGAKYGYILTSGSAPLHDMLVELGIDVLIGPDPVQGKATDLRAMGQELGGHMCLWGGVNGFVTVEMGTAQEIDTAVREAIDALGPEGFILSPVDNIRDPSDAVWQNVLALIESWKRHRG